MYLSVKIEENNMCFDFFKTQYLIMTDYGSKNRIKKYGIK